MDGQQTGGLPLNFSLNDARDMNCSCGNGIFMPGMKFKKISRLIVAVSPVVAITKTPSMTY